MPLSRPLQFEIGIVENITLFSENLPDVISCLVDSPCIDDVSKKEISFILQNRFQALITARVKVFWGGSG